MDVPHPAKGNVATPAVGTGANLAKLTLIRRGVRDPAATAEFFGWLFDLPSQATGAGFRLGCTNGDLVVDADVSKPITFGLETGRSPAPDPDGVPVVFKAAQASRSTLTLDHVRLNCADLLVAVRFYRELGFVVTWSGVGDDERDGLQDEPIPKANWVHLSGADGYLSLSQADWEEFGPGKAASGPPRFVHIGLAVQDLDTVISRLEGAGIAFLPAPPNYVGKRIYFNDPDGDASLGTNVELTEYATDVSCSGRIALS